MYFITVVPAVRTILGVEEFDYAIDAHADVRVGDVIRVPFRKRPLAAIIIDKKADSAYADRALHVGDTTPLLRLGSTAANLLTVAAHRSFTSKPSILTSWLRTVPLRAKPPVPTTSSRAVQHGMPHRETRYLIDRWRDPAGLIPFARTQKGRTLIITPWQQRADRLAKDLNGYVLHAHVADGAAWRTVQQFCAEQTTIVVATRIGAWLACVADTVLIDEPENDDLKQDELSPRLDARWYISTAAAQRTALSIIAFATTPRLSITERGEWTCAPIIPLDLRTELKQRRAASPINGLTAQAVNEIRECIEQEKPVRIIHAVAGDRARVVCRDCSWSAGCAFCGFPLGLASNTGLCRSCGKVTDLPTECPSCHGTDFTRAAVGRDRLAEQCATTFQSTLLQVTSVADVHIASIPKNCLVVITEFSLLGGVVEDTRRRERLCIAWRRIAATLCTSQARVIVQGSENGLSDCRAWLTSEGVAATWKSEYADRTLFGYPPATHLIKLLVDGSEERAQLLNNQLAAACPTSWRVNGPYPVAFRTHTRSPRWIIHLIAPLETAQDELFAFLKPFQAHAIIDLDPIAFFT